MCIQWNVKTPKKISNTTWILNFYKELYKGCILGFKTKFSCLLQENPQIHPFFAAFENFTFRFLYKVLIWIQCFMTQFRGQIVSDIWEPQLMTHLDERSWSWRTESLRWGRRSQWHPHRTHSGSFGKEWQRRWAVQLSPPLQPGLNTGQRHCCAPHLEMSEWVKK